MDKPLPDDFDPYEARVNYGRQEGDNSKIVFWLLGGLMTINVSISVAFFTWTAKSIVDMQTDIAVIKCQLSTNCPKVLSHGSEQNRP
jgi:hypothetical protein